MRVRRVQQTLELPPKFDTIWTPSRYKAWHGGRGGAKSHSAAAALVTMGSVRPMRILCCREIQRSLSASVKQLLDDKIALLGLGHGPGGNGLYRSTERSIVGQNGTQFLFAGLRTNPDSIKSMEALDLAWIEEANTVSQTSLQLLTPTLRKPGSEIWATWNRRNKKDPVDNMFLGGTPPPRSIVTEVNWRDNPWFPDVLYEEMMWDKSRDHDKWLHVWEGHPIIRSEARVFQNWRVEDLDHLVPDGCVVRLGADWGFAVDPTVLVECYVFGRTLYFRREAYKVKCEIDETPSLFAGTDVREDDPRWTNPHGHTGFQSVRDHTRIVADSARPETISYMAKRGFNIVRARKGAGSVEEGVEFMKSYDIVVHPDCVHVQDELAYYSYKEDPLTDEVLSILADRHNHTIDACRYALEGVRRHDRGPTATVGPEVITLDEGDDDVDYSY